MMLNRTRVKSFGAKVKALHGFHSMFSVKLVHTPDVYFLSLDIPTSGADFRQHLGKKGKIECSSMPF